LNDRFPEISTLPFSGDFRRPFEAVHSQTDDRRRGVFMRAEGFQRIIIIGDH
jgi:hypothetical protein